MRRDILQLGNPLLWEASSPAADLEAARPVIEDLRDTLAAFREERGFGRAIAAPQIGALTRILYVDMPDGSFAGALLNPAITAQSATQSWIWDDCFSFPDLMVLVRRAVTVDVAYQDESGAARALRAQGDLAELLQHEIDHLDGVLAIDRAPGARNFCSRAEWETRYREARGWHT